MCDVSQTSKMIASYNGKKVKYCMTIFGEGLKIGGEGGGGGGVKSSSSLPWVHHMVLTRMAAFLYYFTEMSGDDLF